MAHNPTPNSTAEEEKEMEGVTSRKKMYEDIVTALPLDESWPGLPRRKYQNFWYPEDFLPVEVAIQRTFTFRPSDIILVTQPKSGTTWLKALTFSIVNRNKYSSKLGQEHPLLTSNPHNFVPFLDFYYDRDTLLPDDTLNTLPTPRLIHLHTPYSSLPVSVHESGCRMMYLCRDPKDTSVSLWHFLNDAMPPLLPSMKPLPFTVFFELFCKGLSPFGPIWEHQLEYWLASRRQPDKILFLKYEEMKADTAGHVKKMAEFMGCPFSDDEEGGGMVEEIVRLCSFKNLSAINREVSLDQVLEKYPVKSSAFFRKGVAGDWKNYMTSDMARRLDEITEEKFRGSGLSFQSCS